MLSVHRAPDRHPVQREEVGVAFVRPSAEGLHSLGQLCVRLRRVEGEGEDAGGGEGGSGLGLGLGSELCIVRRIVHRMVRRMVRRTSCNSWTKSTNLPLACHSTGRLSSLSSMLRLLLIYIYIYIHIY